MTEEELNALIREIAEDFGGIDPALLRAMVYTESRDDPAAISEAGALGLMQINPITAEHLGLVENAGDAWDWEDPRTNLEGGARYLQELLKRFGTEEDALRAYNAGPSYIEDGREFPETEQYVADVLGAVPGYEEAFAPPSVNLTISSEESPVAAGWNFDAPGVDMSRPLSEIGGGLERMARGVLPQFLEERLLPGDEEETGVEFDVSGLDNDTPVTFRVVDGPPGWREGLQSAQIGPTGAGIDQAYGAYKEARKHRADLVSKAGVASSVGTSPIKPAAAAAMGIVGGVSGVTDLLAQGGMPMRYPAGEWTLEVVTAPETTAFGYLPVEGAPRATPMIWDDVWAATVAGAEEAGLEGIGHLFGNLMSGAGAVATRFGTFANQGVERQFMDHYHQMAQRAGYKDFLEFVQRFRQSDVTGESVPGMFGRGMPSIKSGRVGRANREQLDKLVKKSVQLQDNMVKRYLQNPIDRSDWAQKLLKTDFAKELALTQEFVGTRSNLISMQRLAAIAGYRVIKRPVDAAGRYAAPAVEELQDIAFRPDWLPENLALKPVQPEITIEKAREFVKLASRNADNAFRDALQQTRRELNPTRANEEANNWLALWGIARDELMEGLAKSEGGDALVDAYKMQSLRTQQAGALRALAYTDDVPYSLWRVAWGIPGVLGGATGALDPWQAALLTGAFGTVVHPALQQKAGRGLSFVGNLPLPQNMFRAWQLGDDADIAGMTPPGLVQDALGPQFDPSLRRPNTHHQQDAWGGASGRTYRRDRPRAGSAPGQ